MSTVFVMSAVWMDGDSWSHTEFLSAHASKSGAHEAALAHMAKDPDKSIMYSHGPLPLKEGRILCGDPDGAGVDLESYDYVIEEVELLP